VANRRQLLLALATLSASASALADDSRPRLLSVGGEGEVRVAPDRADVGLGVEASEKTLAAAEKKVTEGSMKLLKLCDSLGIPKNQVRSAQISIQPLYDYSKGGGQRPLITGYVVSRQLDVDLRELALLGKLLQGALDAGANRVTGPAFDSSKRDEHQRTALSLAAEDARANAQQIAKTLGVKLGGLHSLSASGGGGMPPTPMMRPSMMMEQKASGGDQTYQAGEITFSATVTADFDLP
jgi:uncharacterized protein YggE